MPVDRLNVIIQVKTQFLNQLYKFDIFVKYYFLIINVFIARVNCVYSAIVVFLVGKIYIRNLFIKFRNFIIQHLTVLGTTRSDLSKL